MEPPLCIAIVEKNILWVGFQKFYLIFRVGHGKCLGLHLQGQDILVIVEWYLLKIFFWKAPIHKVLTIIIKSACFALNYQTFKRIHTREKAGMLTSKCVN